MHNSDRQQALSLRHWAVRKSHFILPCTLTCPKLFLPIHRNEAQDRSLAVMLAIGLCTCVAVALVGATIILLYN